jgi:signal transduction histidine kinase
LLSRSSTSSSPPGPSVPPASTEPDWLGAWENHLAREATLLSDLIESLQQIRAAFGSRDQSALQQQQQRQLALAAQAQQLAGARESLRQRLAARLGLARHQVTLQTLAGAAGPEGIRLAEASRRLRALAAEAQGLLASTSELVGCARSLLRDLLAGDGAGERYDPAGRRQDAACQVFIEARG